MFLIDCASREGMSGAPVIQFSRDGAVRVGGMNFMGSGPAAALQGIYVGRMVDEEAPKEDRLFEAQLGIVWKRRVIDEIIYAQVAGLHSEHVVSPPATIEAAVRDCWPQAPSHFGRILAIDDFRRGIVRGVLKHLKGSANPKDVYSAVLTHAQTLQAAQSQQ